LKIPVHYSKDETALPTSTNAFSSTIVNCCRDIQNNVISHNNSQLDLVHNLFDSALENATSKISLAGDSFSSELLLTEKPSSKYSLVEAKESIVKPTIHEEIENTFKELQDHYEKWYGEFASKIESKEKEVTQLKGMCKDGDSDKEVVKEQALEIEALKCSITNLQASMEQMKEQLIKKQMLMDAKECQLIEMEEQTKKDNQKYTLRLEEISEEKRKEVKDLNDFLEEKMGLISELEEQSIKQSTLVDATEKQLVELTEELRQQKECYESEYKQLLSDKGKEIAAMYKELEDTLKGKDALENLMQSQEVAMKKLQEELGKFNELSNTKDQQMHETEQDLRREIEALECRALEKDKEIVHIQNTLNDSVVGVSMLRDEVAKNKEVVQKLEEELKEYNLLVEQKQAEVGNLEAKLHKEREGFASELSEMVGNKDKEIDTIQSALDESIEEKNVLENLQDDLSKQKEKFASDLKELSNIKGKEISAI